jgi:urocanate hydratase
MAGAGARRATGRAFDAILRSLAQSGADETLLVQSGKPVAIFRTHEDAPRVLLANSNIVPAWATQENFEKWERDGLIMYGQMTAGSWIYIGTQGILQGTYETFGSLARQHGWGTLKGKFVLTAGLGEMGGAQPLAITMNGGVGLLVEVDRWRAERRLHLRQIDAITDNLEEAMTWVEEARAARNSPSPIGLIGNAAEVLPELVARGVQPDVVTDQTSAHDPLYGYIPVGMTLGGAAANCASDPRGYVRRSIDAMTRHVQAMLDWQAAARSSSTMATTCASAPSTMGCKAFATLALCPPISARSFAKAKDPSAGWRSPATRGHLHHRQAILELFPKTNIWRAGFAGAKEVAFQGLPARICWLGYGERARAGLKFNELVASGAVKAPIVIGRDHLDSGSVASPNRETEACATAPTPSPTGRCSTRWSTRSTAPPGSASTTAAAWASATASTPAR